MILPARRDTQGPGASEICRPQRRNGPFTLRVWKGETCEDTAAEKVASGDLAWWQRDAGDGAEPRSWGGSRAGHAGEGSLSQAPAARTGQLQSDRWTHQRSQGHYFSRAETQFPERNKL